MQISSDSVAAVVARSLKARGVTRVFALCGGHIMPSGCASTPRASGSSTCATSGPPSTWRRPITR